MGNRMSRRTGSLNVVTTLLIVFVIVCYPCFEADASSLPETVKLLNVETIGSVDEMKAAMELLNTCSVQAIKEDKFTLSLQELILAKLAQFIDKLVSFHGKAAWETDAAREEEKRLFLAGREIIKKIVAVNKKTLSDMQEKLDDMEDPLAFFKTPEWQRPQNLAATSSYWLGWNGYYSSLLLREDDPTRKMFLEEALEGFSRAFVDSGKDTLIVASLFGRGLCYKEMKVYQKALKDFQSVREAVKKDDLLYARCRYQEALINNQMGDQESAPRHLDEIDKESTGKRIPDEMRLDLKKLRAAVSVAVLEKRVGEETKEINPEKRDQRTFAKLKELAANDPTLNAGLYEFTQKHAPMLERLPKTELGPPATLAMADWYLYRNEYDKALDYYLGLMAESPSILRDQMDALYFHIAYAYCKKEAWNNAIPFLETFHTRFPGSSFTRQAVSLYFAATAADYRKDSSEKRYKKFIDSAQVYLKQCTDCPDRSEAHFQVGDYYQQTGSYKEALSHFRQVEKDSPNYGLARYRVLQSRIEDLELLDKKAGSTPGADAEDLRDLTRLTEEFGKTNPRQDGGEDQRVMEPYTIILQARLNFFNPHDGYRESLKTLEEFEVRFPGQKTLFPEVMSIRTKCYARLAMLKEVEVEIDRFINGGSLDSERYEALHNLAEGLYDEVRAFQRKGEKVFARRYTAVALTIYGKLCLIPDKHPSNKHRASIQLQMARIYTDEGQPRQALAMYKEILKDNPFSSDVLYEVGLLYEKSGQWEDAMTVWKGFTDQVKAGSPIWIESRYRTAYAFKMLGKKDAACTIVTATLTVHPDGGNEQMKKKYLELQPEVCEKGR